MSVKSRAKSKSTRVCGSEFKNSVQSSRNRIQGSQEGAYQTNRYSWQTHLSPASPFPSCSLWGAADLLCVFPLCSPCLMDCVEVEAILCQRWNLSSLLDLCSCSAPAGGSLSSRLLPPPTARCSGTALYSAPGLSTHSERTVSSRSGGPGSISSSSSKPGSDEAMTLLHWNLVCLFLLLIAFVGYLHLERRKHSVHEIMLILHLFCYSAFPQSPGFKIQILYGSS